MIDVARTSLLPLRALANACVDHAITGRRKQVARTVALAGLTWQNEIDATPGPQSESAQRLASREFFGAFAVDGVASPRAAMIRRLVREVARDY